jgi:hypothetical protein
MVGANAGSEQMMSSKHADQDPRNRWLTVEEVRLISDLRVMHAKVDELYHVVATLKKRHGETVIHKYADHDVMGENIAKVDEIYLWFVKLNELRRAANRSA